MLIKMKMSQINNTGMEDARRILRPRREDAHKGDFGHALLVCGSCGMAGAAVLATMGALRSGCGLVTVHLPASERAVIHCTCPSAMVDSDPQGHFSILPSVLEKYTAVGCGCGLGRHPETAEALSALLDAYRKPKVLDADALNIIAASPELLESVPEGSVFTPHLGELRRLTGAWDSREEMLEKAVALAVRTRSCVVVKGPHSAVIAPDGQVFCNSTGNPGMATGGSGDVLTGLLTGLLASGYESFDAARLGVWLHGRAGDIAALHYGQNGMNSRDIADCLGEAFLSLEKSLQQG